MDKQYAPIREYKVRNYQPTKKQYNPKLSIPKVKAYVQREPPKLQTEYTKPLKMSSKPLETKYKEYVPAWSKAPGNKLIPRVKKQKLPVSDKTKKSALPGFSSIGCVTRMVNMFSDSDSGANFTKI